MITDQGAELAVNTLGVVIDRSQEIYVRADFARLCNERGYIDAVEVGVDRGEFARAFLDQWTGITYWAVDPWLPYPDMPWPRDGDLMMAACSVLPHAQRVRLIRWTSAQLSAYFRQGQMTTDFVYIDGAHTYDAVKRDIQHWWDLIRPRGILAGHDFDRERVGLRTAVIEHAAAQGRKIWLTSDTPESWYMYREEPDRLFIHGRPHR